MLQLIVLIVVAYIIGSIPTGILIARLFGIKDIREHGSGSMGATNVARVLGKKFFVPIFLLDAGKAGLLIWLMQKYAAEWLPYSPWAIVSIAIALLIGNGYSLFLRFGASGKGVATSVGILVALCPKLLILPFLVWLLVLFITRRIGIASVASLVALALTAWYAAVSAQIFFLMLFIACWGIWLHRAHVRTVMMK